ETGWIEDGQDTSEEYCGSCFSTHGIAQRYSGAFFGVDAPRELLCEPRINDDNEKVGGRCCEVKIHKKGLGPPQWTPVDPGDRGMLKPWLKRGLDIYDALEEAKGSSDHIFEVFPTASYKMLGKEQAASLTDPNATVTFSFEQFQHGHKDMLDAIISALTVKEYVAGNGDEVGGEDNLGTIILPRKLPDRA
ncbi:MAG: hypothetical protein ABEH43_04625, partial [Flavobacteriales bacterium]